ncbi:prepilin-type N-terminal cleavage/methylation domain-containing protein [Patescibacteria group bacterium]|nr:prepilin-type N-terminal cleavage/methylation domain-containing protein [Patescibacteria group bacterium]
MKKHGQTGFTLVELLVVIAIIGILAGLVLTSLVRTRQKGRDSNRQSDLRQISLAMEMAYDDNQAYPTGITIPPSITAAGNTYMTAVPTDPQNGNYAWTNNTGNNQLYCVGADLELGDYFTCSQDGCRPAGSNCI